MTLISVRIQKHETSSISFLRRIICHDLFIPTKTLTIKKILCTAQTDGGTYSGIPRDTCWIFQMGADEGL